MKINDSGLSVKLLPKGETKVGEVYATANGTVFFRCQGGFANMGSGCFVTYEEVTISAQWQHLPHATLVING